MAIKNLLHHLNLRSTRLLPKFTLTSKIIISFFVVISLSFFIKSVNAATTTPNNNSITVDTTEVVNGYSKKETAIEKGNNQESWIYESLASNGTALITSIAGPQSDNVKNVLTSIQTSTPIAWKPGGLIGATTQGLSYLYQTPVSGVEYIANSVNSFLGKPTYAADSNGFGFSKLDGIMNMWKMTRNAVYTLISLFFIIVGIMIILRVKINPQTTVTVQSAIPKIISSLILVTFSYAIAGLMIDLSNVVLGVVLSIMNNSIDLSSTIGKTLTDTMSLGFFDTFRLIQSQLFGNMNTLYVTLAGFAAGGITAFFLVAASSPVLGLLSFIFFTLIIFIFILIQLVKLFFGLAKCYVLVLIQIIIAPIQIGMGAIPGSKINFSTWFKKLTSQIAVFPATTIFLVFSVFLVKTLSQTSQNLWSPTMIGSGGLISFLVGFACLSILSKIPEIVPEVIFGIKPSPVGKMISESNPLPGIYGSLKKGVSERFGGEMAEGARERFEPVSGWFQRIKEKRQNRQASTYTPKHLSGTQKTGETTSGEETTTKGDF